VHIGLAKHRAAVPPALAVVKEILLTLIIPVSPLINGKNKGLAVPVPGVELEISPASGRDLPGIVVIAVTLLL
jgi:hypothetical protein